MTHDPLVDLLKQADSPVRSAADSPAALAAKVRTEVRKRKARRRAVAAAAVVLCIFGGSVAMLKWNRREVAVAPPQVKETQAPETADEEDRVTDEIAALRSEADSLQRIVRRTIALRNLDELRDAVAGEAAVVDPRLEIRDLADRAAISLLARAERKLESNRDEAVAAFKRTMELFPGTEWAVAAHEKLTRIEKGTM